MLVAPCPSNHVAVENLVEISRHENPALGVSFQ
jgi:hypothetical protein